MGAKLAITLGVLLASFSSFAQVQPSVEKSRIHVNFSAGGGMGYWAGDWKDSNGQMYRWGPAAWVTATLWHCLGMNVEGHSMIVGGDSYASNYKLFVGEGGLMCTMGYWGRFQPIYKAELGLASFSHPPNGSGQLHDTYRTWSVGGGGEYHTVGHWWTRVDFTYEAIPDFYSGISHQKHTLNPRGIAFGETYRFGASGTRF